MSGTGLWFIRRGKKSNKERDNALIMTLQNNYILNRYNVLKVRVEVKFDKLKTELVKVQLQENLKAKIKKKN